MALIIGDNFSYLGAKPLDGRLSYATISAMAGMAASSLYDGIMAFCVETGKEYQWKSANTEDPTLGKWREFETGGALVLGETSSTAYRGDRGKAAYDFSQNPATATPEMDGVGAAGSSGKWAREDHVHPSDTTKADNDIIAPAFDETETYAIGDRVTYNGGLYRFTSAHTGAWVAGDATEVTVDGEIPQELTAAQMQAIKDAFEPTVRPDMMPVLFDETGAERVVGWYKLANGTKKPVYRKDYACGAGPNNTTKTVAVGFELTAIHIIDSDMIAWNPTTCSYHKLSYMDADIYYIKDNYINIKTTVDMRSFNFYASLYYTKNSDTPV